MELTEYATDLLQGAKSYTWKDIMKETEGKNEENEADIINMERYWIIKSKTINYGLQRWENCFKILQMKKKEIFFWKRLNKGYKRCGKSIKYHN